VHVKCEHSLSKRGESWVGGECSEMWNKNSFSSSWLELSQWIWSYWMLKSLLKWRNLLGYLIPHKTIFVMVSQLCWCTEVILIGGAWVTVMSDNQKMAVLMHSNNDLSRIFISFFSPSVLSEHTLWFSMLLCSVDCSQLASILQTIS